MSTTCGEILGAEWEQGPGRQSQDCGPLGTRLEITTLDSSGEHGLYFTPVPAGEGLWSRVVKKLRFSFSFLRLMSSPSSFPPSGSSSIPQEIKGPDMLAHEERGCET